MYKKLLLTLFFLASATQVCASPEVIAHRGGTGDAPENTVLAITTALKNNADAVWLTVQMSKDEIPVLYRPSDLKTLTNYAGPVSSFTAGQLATANAGYYFGAPDFPYRNKGISIPTLESVLTKWQKTKFFIDIKSPDASPEKLAKALEKVLRDTKSLQRTRVYSTDEKYLNALPKDVQRFISRDQSRTTLANILMAHQCNISSEESAERWYGLELKREVDVVEKFTLGEGHSPSTLIWDENAMKCFHAKSGAHIILFNINTPEDYHQAVQLGADGVLVDSPSKFNRKVNL
ncbi:glycerophosphodiester phosphodiesterase family protein [Rahnella aceris]|uniref:glycerophosphodiester phosphodiesterase family protein n=1 Tax=Rahnella sp. (strain Y9602) TaxID=2703885 RepID=UPI001C27C078|nr:glycerophosphodiester phosphodiesterase family protein [Rahnella aceris]MBU9852704.1 glycerophosphodiester phosphodiesterase [Rahnella aceris]